MVQYAEDALKVNDQIIEIQWIESDGNRFSTLCLARDTGIIWDNILTGVVMMDEPQEAYEGGDNSRAYNSWYKKWWWVEWIWGSKRGEVGYKITIYYYCSGKVCSTDAEDWGWMNLGSAKSESKVLVNSGQTYGKIKYALGLATPAGSLSFNASTFTVSFSGLGSNVVQNGTKSWFLP